MPDLYAIDWNFGRKARAWRNEAMDRWELTPEKIEMADGKLFYTTEKRLLMIGMLLENVGLDSVVRLGDPNVWGEVIAALPE